MPNRLHLVDLDGTVNDIDIRLAFERRGSPEVAAYIHGAAKFVSERTGLPEEEVLTGLKQTILHDVLPYRTQYDYWGTFPMSDGRPAKICPAVDHYLLMYAAVPIFLWRRILEEDARSDTVARIYAFLDSNWKYPLFSFASDCALPHAEIEADAVGALQEILRRNEFVAIVTNSSTRKAEDLLKQAGFGDRLEVGGVSRGKIGVMGDAMKFQIDPNLPKDGQIIDLSGYFGFPEAKVDNRRRVFRTRMRQLFTAVGAGEIIVYSDIPELDNYPLAAEFGERARHGMKLNPTSVDASVDAAMAVLYAATSRKLSELVKKLS